MLLQPVKGSIVSPCFLLTWISTEPTWALHSSQGWWICDRRAQGTRWLGEHPRMGGKWGHQLGPALGPLHRDKQLRECLFAFFI